MDRRPAASSQSEPGDATSMASVPRIRMSIFPWMDRDFVHAVEDAWLCVRMDKALECWSVAATVAAEGYLHRAGYPGARVIDQRSIEEALDHVAHWRVIRDGAGE
jgi:hypothetical protein